MVKNTENELSKDHILVCLSSSPSNERIVRMAGKWRRHFVEALPRSMYRRLEIL